MSSHVPVPGAFCEVDKDNATRDTSTGQGMFVSATRKAVATDLEHSLLDLVIFDSVASASARADAEKAATAGAIGAPAPDITTAEGFVKKVDNVKRKDLHHFTSNKVARTAPDHSSSSAAPHLPRGPYLSGYSPGHSPVRHFVRVSGVYRQERQF